MKKILAIVLCFAISGCSGLAVVEPTATARTTTLDQDLSERLLPLLLHPEDINLEVNWRRELTSFGSDRQIGNGLVGWTDTIFDGEMEDSIIYFEHRLECYTEKPLLEPPDRSGRTEIALSVPEFGDKSLSLCYHTSDNQVKGCNVNIQYSNLISKLFVRTTPHLSDTQLLEEMVNDALTIINKRVKNIPICK